VVIATMEVKGIYVSWTNDPPNPKVKDWNVTELKVRHMFGFVKIFAGSLCTFQIDPHRRHVDKSTVAYFWKTLDTWTALHKPSLVNA
jgi:parafibromin